MPYLNWISDDNLVNHTQTLLVVAQQARIKKQREFHRNVIDPFLAIFEMAGYATNSVDWRDGELTRQVGKTVHNDLGLFHQNVSHHMCGQTNVIVRMSLRCHAIVLRTDRQACSS